VHLTIIQAKRILPAATPRVSASVVLIGDGSMWLDPQDLDQQGSFG
jgi:hypothetical protein